MNTVEPIRNKDDLEKIINFAKENYNPNMNLILNIGLHSGLRVSDILNLKVKNVKDKDFIEIIEQKTAKYKKFPIQEQTKKMIKDYIALYKKQDDEYLFLGEKGNKMHRSIVYRFIHDICNRCNIKNCNVGTHTMRKTFGYHHYKQFKDVALLQTIFNHSAPSITLRYIGITQDEINNSYKNFDLLKQNTICENENYKSMTIADNYCNIQLLNKIKFLENKIKQYEENNKYDYFVKEIRTQKNTIDKILQKIIDLTDLIQNYTAIEKECIAISYDEGIIKKDFINTAYDEKLTKREYQILQYIMNGYNLQDIKNILYIEVSTIKNHLHSIFEKWNVKTMQELLVKAFNILPYGKI